MRTQPISGESETVGRLLDLVNDQAWDDAIALAADRWQEMLEPDRFDVLVDGLRSMPTEVYIDDVHLALAAGAIFLTWGLSEEADVRLDAESVLDDPSARATATALRAHATWWTTRPDRALGLLDQLEADLGANPGLDLVPTPGFEPMTTGRSMLAVSRARALALCGEIGPARTLLGDLAGRDETDPVADSVSAWSTKAWVDAMAGDLSEARSAVDIAFDLAEPDGWDVTPALAPARLAMALINVRSAGPGDGSDLVADATEVAQRSGAFALVRLCEATAAMCGQRDRVDGIDARSGQVFVPVADTVLAAWRARDALRAGDIALAKRHLTDLRPHELTVGPWTEASLAVRGLESTARVLGDLPAPLTPVGRIGSMLAGASIVEDGDERRQQVRSAVEAARGHDLAGVLAEGPAGLAELVLEAVDDLWPDARLRTTTATDTAHRPELSARERQILGLLDGPLTVKEISEGVYLSPHTTKWYLSRIYRKLGADSRADAVERARQLGWTS